MRTPARILLLLASLSACADDGDCPPVEVCAITEPSCQHAIMRSVSCLRGGRTPMPLVSVLSEDALLERLRRDDTRTDEQKLAYARWLNGQALLRMAPLDYGQEQAYADAVSGYAAVYLGDTREVIVVDRGESLATEEAVQLFAHELVHALQDAEHGLRAWRDQWVIDVDSSIATDAVVEGEATFYELLVSTQLAGVDPRQVDWEGYFTRWRTHQLGLAELDAVPVSMADLRFPYAFGGGYVMQHWLAGGHDAVRALWRRPPQTTREVMFGPFVRDAARQSELATHSLPHAPGFELVGASPLGAWLMRQFVARIGVPLDRRLEAAEILGYDMFTVQVEPTTGELLAGWHLDFDEERAMPELGDGLRTWRDGPTQWFMAASSTRPSLGMLAWGPLERAAESEQDNTASVPVPPPLRHAASHTRPPRFDEDR